MTWEADLVLKSSSQSQGVNHPNFGSSPASKRSLYPMKRQSRLLKWVNLSKNLLQRFYPNRNRMGWYYLEGFLFRKPSKQTLPGLFSSLELNNVSTFHFLLTRMVLQQKKVLAQFELQQQIRLESLKQKLLGLHHLETELENQLKVSQGKMTHRSEAAHSKTSNRLYGSFCCPTLSQCQDSPLCCGKCFPSASHIASCMSAVTSASSVMPHVQ